MLLMGFMGNHALDLLGIVYMLSTAVKMARGYPIKRWFW